MMLPMLYRGYNKSYLQFRKVSSGYNMRLLTTSLKRYASSAAASRHTGARNTV